MRKIEKEEAREYSGAHLNWTLENVINFVFSNVLCFILQEQVAYDDPDKKIYHLCIVNLVIGLVSFFCPP